MPVDDDSENAVRPIQTTLNRHKFSDQQYTIQDSPCQSESDTEHHNIWYGNMLLHRNSTLPRRRNYQLPLVASVDEPINEKWFIEQKKLIVV